MLEIAIGLAIVAVLLFDIFQAALVPRFTPAALRIAPLLVGKLGWPYYRKIASFINNEVVLDLFLGSFAPLAFLAIFALWLFFLTCSFAMIIQGLGNEFAPQVKDFVSAIYLAGTALLTLGFGDIVAVSPLGRALMLLGGATGITVVGVAISFLFSMEQSVHTREAFVHTMQSRISPQSSGLSLILNYADRDIEDNLAAQIQDWETWLAQVLTSHRSFPLLFYFRSGHMCVSWLTVMGAMLDAANLLTTTVNDRRFRHAEFFLAIGTRTVSFFRNYFKLDPVKTCISREEFKAAYAMLSERTFQLYDEESAWQRFHSTRSQYAPSLNALAFNFVCHLPGFLPDMAKSISEYSEIESFV